MIKDVYYSNLDGLGDTAERRHRHATNVVGRILDPGPSDREWVENGVRNCYVMAGWDWHDNVVWVGSPDVLHFAAVAVAAQRCRLAELAHIEAPVRLRHEIDEAVARAVERSPHVRIEQREWSTAVSAESDGRREIGVPSAGIEVATRSRAIGALGLRQLRVANEIAGELLSPSLERSLDEGIIGERVASEAQAPLRMAMLLSLHGEVHPALTAARRSIDKLSATALSLIESSIEMGSQARRACYDYLINDLEIGQPVKARHDALQASEAAGWTWMHRDVSLICERHDSIQTTTAPPGSLTSTIVASDDGPCLTWENGAHFSSSLAA